MRKRAVYLYSAGAAAVGALTLLGASSAADARITNIVIITKTSPAFGGQSFGSAGQYEQLDGTASGEIDPKDPLNAVIQDIELAPRNSRGMVEYSMDISIVKPINTSHGNHTILYDVVNPAIRARSLSISEEALPVLATVFLKQRATRSCGADGRAISPPASRSISRSPRTETARR